jgi:hypothetical protein
MAASADSVATIGSINHAPPFVSPHHLLSFHASSRARSSPRFLQVPDTDKNVSFNHQQRP